MGNYYRNLRKKQGKRVKKHKTDWRMFVIILAVVVFIALVTVAAVRCSKYLSTNPHFIVEANCENTNREYDYNNSELTAIEKFSIGFFYNVSDNVNSKVPGSYKVIYDSRLAFMPNHEHTVEVVDTTAPEIYLEPLDEEMKYQSIDEFVDPGYYAVDNCDAFVPVETEIYHTKPCWYMIRYTATDKAGNTSERYREVNVIRGQVALTFDDGPSLNITPEILDILGNNQVPATFFILGYDAEKQYLVLRECTEGHTIGFHGKSHSYKDIYTSLDTLMQNFISLEEDVMALTGYSSKLIRFPGGSSNTVSINYCQGIMSKAVTEVANHGYTYFDWNVDSGDAGRATTPDEVYDNVVAGIRQGRLNVVLMHDSASKTHTLNALQRIIDYCSENDYEFIKLTSESPQVTHRVAN